MFSYVFMKILEMRPRSYDQRVDRASSGTVQRIKHAVAEQIPQGAQVLEIGCGTGELASLLVSRGAAVDGFDLSPSMVTVAEERIVSEELEGKFSVRHMGVEGMDSLSAGTYDAVVSTLVFSELSPDERRFALKHALRILKSGGRLVITDEVVPRSAGRRFVQSLVRVPLLAITYLVAGTTTRPIADLAGEIAAAGFKVDVEKRFQGDATALLVASKPKT